MSKDRTVSSAVLGRAMKEADGDYAKAAEILGMSGKDPAQAVKKRVSRDPALRAIWQPNHRTLDPEVRENEVLTQTPNPLLAEENMNAMKVQGEEIYRRGIEKFLGDDPELLERFDVFKGIEDNIGLMFAKTTQFFQTKLVEILCNLSKMDKNLEQRMANSSDPEEYAMFVRLKLQTCDMFGKYYDRNLSGLETMVKLTDKEEEKEKKRKPGFMPLKDMKEPE